MKILFWLNGSGGQRTERKVVDFDFTKGNLIDNVNLVEDALAEWKEEIDCHSEYIRWGWDEHFDAERMEPLSPL